MNGFWISHSNTIPIRSRRSPMFWVSWSDIDWWRSCKLKKKELWEIDWDLKTESTFLSSMASYEGPSERKILALGTTQRSAMMIRESTVSPVIWFGLTNKSDLIRSFLQSFWNSLDKPGSAITFVYSKFSASFLQPLTHLYAVYQNNHRFVSDFVAKLYNKYNFYATRNLNSKSNQIGFSILCFNNSYTSQFIWKLLKTKNIIIIFINGYWLENR